MLLTGLQTALGDRSGHQARQPHPATYGPRTATEAGFGATVAGFGAAPGGQAPGRLVHAVLSAGSLCLLALIGLWISLPS